VSPIQADILEWAVQGTLTTATQSIYSTQIHGRLQTNLCKATATTNTVG